jgi:4-amino-4-deoxy-L-arabinose transferase-like glycosyltransferase
MNILKPTHTLRADAVILAIFASLILVVHFLLGNGYGFYRDELQFLDDARHLQWGFVAYPPLTSFSGRIAIALFGISPQVLRLPAALANATTLVLVGLTARELGGRRTAQGIALCASFPLALAFSSVLEYTTFDLLSWTILIFFAARLLRTDDGRWWIGAGFGVGLGVLSKYSIAFPVTGLLVALLLLPSQRHHLRSRWFWYGVATATVIAAPNLIWLAIHRGITIHMEHYIHFLDVHAGKARSFYSDQILFNMLALPLAIAGLIFLLRSARFRMLAAFYLGPLLLFAILKGRGYYLLPGYPVLYAAGAVALQRVLDARPAQLRVIVPGIVVAAMLVDAAAVAWAVLPMARVGSAQWTWQMKHNPDLPEEFGWQEFVAQVAAVRDKLQPQERSSLAVLANNYGEAGALSLYGPQYGLPVPISGVNNFHLRGYGAGADTVIVVGGDLQKQRKNFQDCSVVAHVSRPYGLKTIESDAPSGILVCHHLREPWPVFWSRTQTFN